MNTRDLVEREGQQPTDGREPSVLHNPTQLWRIRVGRTEVRAELPQVSGGRWNLSGFGAD